MVVFVMQENINADNWETGGTASKGVFVNYIDLRAPRAVQLVPNIRELEDKILEMSNVELANRVDW